MSPNPTDAFPAYYDMGGIPVRKMRAAALPEKLSPDGRLWVPFAEPERFGTEAVRVTPAEFNALAAGFVSPTKTR